MYFTALPGMFPLDVFEKLSRCLEFLRTAVALVGLRGLEVLLLVLLLTQATLSTVYNIGPYSETLLLTLLLVIGFC